MTLVELLQWLENTSLGAIARESLYGFQILVAIHIVGITFSVGTLLWADLRMLGIALKGYRVSVVYRSLAPWFLAGFAVMLGSGAMLFAGFATSAYENPYFLTKMTIIGLAGVNAAVYHLGLQRSQATWDTAPHPPARIRIAGLTSLVLWLTVVFCGRMLSYTLF